MGAGDQRHAPAALPPEKTRYHCIWGLVGPRAGLDRCGKFRPPPGFDLWTVQPVTSRYAEYVILDHVKKGTYDMKPYSEWPVVTKENHEELR